MDFLKEHGALRSMARGFLGRCPNCGRGALFRRYLKINARCPVCDLDLDRYPSDDGPAYFTILIVGHIVIPLMLWMQKADDPSTLLLSAVFVPLTIVLVLGLLRPIKGATVGLMLRLNMMKPDSEMPPIATLPGAGPR